MGTLRESGARSSSPWRQTVASCGVPLRPWDSTTAFAWNSQTNQLLTHAETWLNELRLERDRRYLGLTGGDPGPVPVGALATYIFWAAESVEPRAGQLFFFPHVEVLRELNGADSHHL